MSKGCGVPGRTAAALGWFTLRNASAPQYLRLGKMLWGRISWCEPSAEDGPWVWSSRNGVAPHPGAHGPSCLEQHAGTQPGSPTFFHGGEAIGSFRRAALSSSAEPAALLDG